MRRLLLDTHVLLWWLADDEALGMQTRALIADTRNEVLVSAATVWEMSIKRAKGLLDAPDEMDDVVAGEGFSALPISLRHAQQAGALPDLHRDPFDRMLIAQAQSEGLELLTVDAVIPQYGIRCLSARL